MHCYGNDKKDKRFVFFWGAVIGTLVFAYTFGLDKLNVTYTDWLLVGIDLPQHYMGWVAYRNSPWHFPLGLMDGVMYPHLISVVYTDSVPLFALLFKVLSPILPADFQYFGVFGLLCYILQGGLAAVFVYTATGKKQSSILSSVFCSASLLMMWRMYEHTALAAHWIVIAALYLWIFQEQKIDWKKSALYWSLLSVIAVTTEAYFLPMVWGCLLCDMLGCILKDRDFKRVFAVVLSGIASTLMVGWIFGMFYGDVPSTGEYYGYFAFNLNCFFNSQGFSKIFPALSLFNVYQFEALAYLGAGIFVLILMGLVLLVMNLMKPGNAGAVPDETDLSDDASSTTQSVTGRKNRLAEMLDLPDHMILPTILFFVCFLLVSMGNVISFFGHGIVLPFPEKLITLLSVFRSNGRLIWPVYYAILLFACIYYIRWMKREHAMLMILVACVLLQCYDLSAEMDIKRDIFRKTVTYENALKDPAWEKVAAEYEHVMYYPNVSAAVYNNPISYEIQNFAMEHGMTLNLIYFARNVSAQVNEEVHAYFDDARVNGFDPDTIYVFLAGFPDDDCGLYYYFIDNVLIATPRPLGGVEEFDYYSLLE